MTDIPWKRISLILICVLYLGAGVNHFIHPSVYINLIPPYFPGRYQLNFVAGAFEILSAILMAVSHTRKAGAVIIVLLLIAFIPAHIYLIESNGCIPQSICVPPWIAWVRLFPLQFILMWWAWKTWQWNS